MWCLEPRPDCVGWLSGKGKEFLFSKKELMTVSILLPELVKKFSFLSLDNSI